MSTCNEKPPSSSPHGSKSKSNSGKLLSGSSDSPSASATNEHGGDVLDERLRAQTTLRSGKRGYDVLTRTHVNTYVSTRAERPCSEFQFLSIRLDDDHGVAIDHNITLWELPCLNVLADVMTYKRPHSLLFNSVSVTNFQWRTLLLGLIVLVNWSSGQEIGYGFEFEEVHVANNNVLENHHKYVRRSLAEKSVTAADTANKKHTKKLSPIPRASIVVPMHYDSGSHHVYVYIGSPKPQRQILILDTGSRYMAFPCEPCPDCGNHASKFYFNDTQSTTHRDNFHPNCVFAKKTKKDLWNNSCVFEQTYLEGSSWFAKEVEDLIWLSTADSEESIEEYMPHLAIPFTFGCQYKVTGYFTHQYSDGILGMGKQNDKDSLLQTLVQAQAIDRAAFAMCLSQTGGTLSFGGSGLARPDTKQLTNPEQYHIEPMHYSKLVQDHGLYALAVYNVYIGKYCMTCDNTGDRNLDDEHSRILNAFEAGKGALLDSGTTDTYFPRAAEHIFRKVWEENLGSKLESSRQYTFEEFLKMPIISVTFYPNATLHVPPSSYMEGVPIDIDTTKPDVVIPWEGQRKLTIRVYTEEMEGAVFGANFMYNYDVLYDLEKNRVGFARANCGMDREAQARLNKGRDEAKSDR